MYTVTCPCCNSTMHVSYSTGSPALAGLYIQYHQHNHDCNTYFKSILYHANTSFAHTLTLSDTDIQTFQSHINSQYTIIILKEF